MRAALTAMGIDASSDAAVRAANAADTTARLPATVVAAAGARVALNGALRARTDGARVAVDDETIVVPDLPLGEHDLTVETDSGQHRIALVVVPARCPVPVERPGWGWTAQLYQVRSALSWGMGDLGDLRDLCTWAAAQGASFVMINPLHAAAPLAPQEPSPYFPSSRRFTNPLYLRVEDLPEMAALDPDDRARVAALADEARAGDPGRIDRDRVFAAKMAALALLAAAPRAHARDAALAAFRRERGAALEDYATYCALAEQHGADWRKWPPPLRHPRAAAVVDARGEHADRVAFHCWLQACCADQLAGTQKAARDAGMPVGVIGDVAVGVDPGGADAWALQDDLALAVTVGAPPDALNQRGQDWALPPLLPNRLAATGYAAFRDMTRAVLETAGGARVDHVMGLWRLWWIPEGHAPTEGTYVRYPADALLGLLALEAQRTGALVVGEDLGTVEEGVRETMAERGVLGSRVLLFDRDPRDYEAPVMASVTTHDLPTAAGWWAGEGVRLQTELDLLPDGADAAGEHARAAAERDALRATLADAGVLDEEEPVMSMYRFLGQTSALLVAAAVADAVGDLRQPNLPGTRDEYPNWRLPLADGQGHAVGLEALTTHPGPQRLAALLTALRPS